MSTLGCDKKKRKMFPLNLGLPIANDKEVRLFM